MTLPFKVLGSLATGENSMARPKRFELLTPRFVVWCSIQLSYGRAPRVVDTPEPGRSEDRPRIDVLPSGSPREMQDDAAKDLLRSTKTPPTPPTSGALPCFRRVGGHLPDQAMAVARRKRFPRDRRRIWSISSKGVKRFVPGKPAKSGK